MSGEFCPTELLPAYALGALTADEHATVSEHLQACDSCRMELRAFESVVETLPFAAQPIDPPASLKRSLMAQVSETSSNPTTAAARVPLFERLAALWLRPIPALVGVALLVILILAAGNLYLWRQVQTVPSLPPDLQIVAMVGSESAPGATGLVVFDVHGNEGTLVVDGLEPLGQDEQYQLWLIKNGVRTNGGTFSVSESGYGWLALHSQTPLQQFSAFGITIEPAGGSSGPTGPRVMGGEQ